jgi:hypothetical protein
MIHGQQNIKLVIYIKKENGLKVFNSGDLMKIFEPLIVKVIGAWRRVHNVERRYLHY